MIDQKLRLIGSESKLDIEFKVPEELSAKKSVEDVRQALEETIRTIPDSALRGLRSVRIIVAA